MLNEESALLKAHLAEFPNDYEWYLYLGDAQFAKGLVSEAQTSYSQSKTIAANTQNTDFIAIINSRLNLLKTNTMHHPK